MSFSILALHGFLGSPRDFEALKIPSLYAPRIFYTALGPQSWWVKRQLYVIPRGRIILGYSMGARLALHCVLKNPEHFQAAIIMAAHPGFLSQSAAEERVFTDRLWAKRFMREPWDEVLSAWNSGEVFHGAHVIKRDEGDFSKSSLAQTLTYFSVGDSPSLIAAINLVDLPILWLQPETECEKIKGLNLRHPQSRIEFMKDGGHRFMLSHPQATGLLINRFIQDVWRPRS